MEIVVNLVEMKENGGTNRKRCTGRAKTVHAPPGLGWINSIEVSKNVDFRLVPFLVELVFGSKSDFSNRLAVLFPSLSGQN